MGTDGPRTAITGLSLLAFLGDGDTPDMGRYGLAVRKMTDFLLAHQDADGYFGGGDRGMYSHAIVTLAMCENNGVESNADRRLRIRAAIVKAVQIILTAQDAHKSDPVYVGGWRYERNSPDSDLSLSGWNLLALRAAEDIGITVPKDASRRASEFVIHCYNEQASGFSYQPAGSPQPGETGIGMLCLYVLQTAADNAQKLDASAKFLTDHALDENGRFLYYSSYYVTQATFQRGGAEWSKVGLPLLEKLIRFQEADGGWPQSKTSEEPGRTYATAMAVSALAVPYRLLPVYQR